MYSNYSQCGPYIELDLALEGGNRDNSVPCDFLK